MTLISSYWRLERREKRLVLEALIIVFAVRTGLALMSFSKLLAALERVPTIRGPAARGLDPERIVWAVQTVSRVTPGPDTCLVRAIAVATMLNRRGERTSVCVGITRDDRSGLSAHAWVESGGDVIGGRRSSEAYPTPLPPIEFGGS